MITIGDEAVGRPDRAGHCRADPPGEYCETIGIAARKVRADRVGNETEGPMEDFVEIGVLARGEGDDRGEALYLKRHRIQSGAQAIQIAVSRAPASAGIGPYHKLIDRERGEAVPLRRR